MQKNKTFDKAPKTQITEKSQLKPQQKRIQELQQALKNAHTDNLELRKSALTRIDQMNSQLQQIFKMYSTKKSYSRQNAKTEAQLAQIKKTYENIKANNAMMAEELKKKENQKKSLAAANAQIKSLNETIRKMSQQLKKQKGSKNGESPYSKQTMNKRSSMVEIQRSDNQVREFYENYIKRLKLDHEMEIQELKNKNKSFKNLDSSSERNNLRDRITSIQGQFVNSECYNFIDDGKIRMIIQENVNQAVFQKQYEYSEIIRELQLKNNQQLTHIMALEGAIMVLREQLALNLNKEADKRHQNIKKKRESSLSQSSKRSQPYLKQFKSPRNNLNASFALARQTIPKGNWKNQIGVYRSSNFIGNSNNGRQQVENNAGLLDNFYQHKKNKTFLPMRHQDIISEVIEPKQSLNLQHLKK